MGQKRKLEIVIAGDASGGSRALGLIDDKSGKLGGSLRGLGTAAAVGFGAIIAGGAAVGKVLFDIGQEFDAADDLIRVGTGATGEALEGLEDSFRDVFASVPTDSESAATAIADLNTLLGLTGEALEERSTQFLNLARITGGDVEASIASVSRVFGDWSVSVDDQGEALDRLFRTSQTTGIGMEQLSTQVVQFGAPLRQLGFGLDEASALFGKWQQEGVNTETVMSGLRQGISRLAADGKDIPQGFRDITAAIHEAGSESEATTLAIEAFGARAGPDLAAAIREGRFATGDLINTIAEGGDTINGVAEETESFGEKWTKIKNRLMVAIEPVASALFDRLGQAMDDLGPVVDRVVGWFEGLGTVFEEGGFSAVMAELGDRLREAWPEIRKALGDMADSIIGWVKSTVPKFVSAVTEWAKAYVEWIAPQIPVMLRELGSLVAQAGQWMLDEGLPLFAEKAQEWGKAMFEWVADVVPPLLVELGKLLLELGEWIVTEAAPEIGEHLLEWAKAFGSWIVDDLLPALPPLLADILTTIVNWATDSALPAIGDFLMEWGEKILTWFADLPANVLTALGDLLPVLVSSGWDLLMGLHNGLVEWVPRVLTFMIELPGKVLSALGDLLPTLHEKGVDLAEGLLEGVKGFWTDSIVPWLGSRAIAMIEAVGNLANALYSVGRDFVDGMLEGIKAAWGTLTGWLGDAAGGLKDFITKPLGIFSPSRVMMDVGRSTMEGLAIGLRQGHDALVVPALDLSASGIADHDALTGGAQAGAAGATAPAPPPPAAPAARDLVVQLHVDGKMMAEQIIPALRIMTEDRQHAPAV